jgi:LPS sulfotransferase NodH
MILLISECRTGSTWLTNKIGERYNMLHEKLCGQEMSAKEFIEWFPTSFDDCDGWNLQKYQLPYDSQWLFLSDWCRENGVKVVVLERRNEYEQFMSLEKAMRTGVWPPDCKLEPLPENRIPSFREFSHMTFYQRRQFRRCFENDFFELFFGDLFPERKTTEVTLELMFEFLG